MNEKTEAASCKGLDEASFAFGSTASPVEHSDPPTWRPEKPEDLPGKDLRKADFKACPWLLPEHLAGSDLTGNLTLPPEIAKFPALEQVKAISSEARKIFIGLLAACVYSWLVIGTTTDVALILNTASSPLPIINTPIPIAGFYVVGAALLAAVYCYLHFYLQRLWRTLATLPAKFPDGTALDDKSDPWLLTNLVRIDFARLRPSASPLVRLENLLAVFLAWWVVPLTLVALWSRYLPAHGWLGTTWLVFLIGVTTWFGRQTYRLARAALQGRASPSVNREGDHGVLGRAWREMRQLPPDKLTICLAIGLGVVALSAFLDSPHSRSVHAEEVPVQISPWTIPRALDFLGIRTYADLREVDFAERPVDWDGTEWDKVKRVDLGGRNLAFADLTRAFLANADLRAANLRGAILEEAELQGADLYDDAGNLYGEEVGHDDDARRTAQLQGADLHDARLQGADLTGAQLQGATLVGAYLQDAELSGAQLQGADLDLAQLQGAHLWDAGLQGARLGSAQLQGAFLSGAQLQGADLSGAQLQGADLSNAGLQGASLVSTQLQGADLSRAQLQGADLTFARLQGADLRGARLWRALAPPAHRMAILGARSDTLWELADLRGIDFASMEDLRIDALISEATTGIPDHVRRQQVVSALTTALRVGEGSFLLEAARSQRNFMASTSDPVFEPSLWGQPNWISEDAYDADLAEFLADLACGRDAPPERWFDGIIDERTAVQRGVEAQMRGLALRALYLADVEEPDRVWPALFAKELIGPSCRPATGLPEAMRLRLEQLVAPGKARAGAPDASRPDPVE